MVDVEISYSWLEATGRIRSVTNGLRDAFPNNRSERDTLSISASYDYSENLTIGVEYFFEELATDDWALDGVQPDTVANLLALGASAWNYEQNVFLVNLRYRLGR